MSEGDTGHVRGRAPAPPDPGRRGDGRVLRRLTSGLVVLTLLAATAAYAFDLGPRWFGLGVPSPVEQPAEVAPPPGLTLPEPPAVAPVAAPVAARAADPAAVRRVLARVLDDRRLGRRVGVGVSLLADGQPVWRDGPARLVPASTLKLLTTAAALARLGPDHRFSTTVVAGARPRDVVLVGGGDPLLARRPAGDDAYPPRADVTTLAQRTARALRARGVDRVRLGYDATLFRGAAVNPAWESSYVPDQVVTPISALWVDEGLEPDGSRRSAEPAAQAADVFARALRQRGIRVARVAPAVAAPSSERLAEVTGAPLGQVVERVLDVSDNEGTEVLARHVAIAAGEPATFAGANRAVVATLASLGVDARDDRIRDGSGLSRDNRLSPATLLELLEVAASPEHPELRPVLTGLPVAGFTGSLATRFDSGAPAGRGLVRAKTGTLSGVHGLAGTVTTRDGAVLAFVALADRVRLEDTLDARALLDRAAAALAACRCAA